MFVLQHVHASVTCNRYILKRFLVVVICMRIWNEMLYMSPSVNCIVSMSIVPCSHKPLLKKQNRNVIYDTFIALLICITMLGEQCRKDNRQWLVFLYLSTTGIWGDHICKQISFSGMILRCIAACLRVKTTTWASLFPTLLCWRSLKQCQPNKNWNKLFTTVM